MYNNPYMSAYNPQMTMERIDSQIAELQKMKNQIPNQQPAINQTFQLAPNSQMGMNYVSSLDEVIKKSIVTDTPFFSKDMSVVWIKNTKGDIKTYELNEIIPKDEKDIQIELLMEQINELKGLIKNDGNFTDVNKSEISTDTSGDDESIRESTKESKSSGLQRISGSKKK